jgi:hypothetical protein
MGAKATKDVESLAAIMSARFTQLDARFGLVDTQFVAVERQFARVDAQFAEVKQELRELRADNKEIRDELREIGSKQKALFWAVTIFGTLITLAVTFGKLLEPLWHAASPAYVWIH